MFPIRPGFHAHLSGGLVHVSCRRNSAFDPEVLPASMEATFCLSRSGARLDRSGTPKQDLILALVSPSWISLMDADHPPDKDLQRRSKSLCGVLQHFIEPCSKWTVNQQLSGWLHSCLALCELQRLFLRRRGCVIMQRQPRCSPHRRSGRGKEAR